MSSADLVEANGLGSVFHSQPHLRCRLRANDLDRGSLPPSGAAAGDAQVSDGRSQGADQRNGQGCHSFAVPARCAIVEQYPS